MVSARALALLRGVWYCVVTENWQMFTVRGLGTSLQLPRHRFSVHITVRSLNDAVTFRFRLIHWAAIEFTISSKYSSSVFPSSLRVDSAWIEISTIAVNVIIFIMFHYTPCAQLMCRSLSPHLCFIRKKIQENVRNKNSFRCICVCIPQAVA